MAALTINYYKTTLVLVGAQQIQAPQLPAILKESVAIGATTTPATEIPIGVRLAELHTDTDCYLEYGTSPSATTLWEMGAGETRFYGVEASNKFAVKEK